VWRITKAAGDVERFTLSVAGREINEPRIVATAAGLIDPVRGRYELSSGEVLTPTVSLRTGGLAWAAEEAWAASLAAVSEKPLSPRSNLDAVEPKLFGIGSESCTVGSSEFYLGYCTTRKKLLCLDAGHYHPTESISDKISSVLLYLPEILLHVSRGVRWDSDHVVTLTDDLLAIAREIVAVGDVSRVHIGLDYFDASINRIAAWAIGTRNMLKALLVGLLEPPVIRQAEKEGDFTARLMLQEEAKTLPFGPVWDHYCLTKEVPVGNAWLDDVRKYEKTVTGKRT